MTKPNRCKHCKRIIRQSNKSGYCFGCSSNEKKKKKRREKCYICEEKCSGKLLIEHKKTKFISLCTIHFNELNKINDPKELRKRAKYLKSYH